MPLTPEQLQEMQELEELEQLEAQFGGQSAPDPQAPRFGDSVAAALPEWAKNAIGAQDAVRSGVLKGGTLGYAESPTYEHSREQHPVLSAMGEAAGALGPGMATGAGAAGMAGRMGGGALARIGANALASGGEGFARNPESGSRIDNAKSAASWAGGISAGLEGLLKGSKVVGSGLKALGGKLASLSKSEADAYANDPRLAEELYRLNKDNPIGLSNRVKDTVKGGIDEAFDRVSEPALEKVGQQVAGKKIEVRPEDFQGTAAGDEIKRSWATRGHTGKIDVPVFEKHSVTATPVKSSIERNGKKVVLQPEVRMSPVEEKLKYGKPSTNYLPENPGDIINPSNPAPEAQVSTIERLLKKAGPEQVVSPEVSMMPVKPKITKAGKEQELEELLLPRGKQRVEYSKKAPESFSMEGPQALSAKRASQKAAGHARALNPIGYNPANDAEALAAGRMRKAIEAVAPDSVGLNDILEESARYSSHAKETLKNNPAAILTNSESTGSVPTRAMRQFLDKHSGTNLEALSQALSAGKAINDPDRAKGVIERVIAKPAGKALLKTSRKFPRSMEPSLGSLLTAPGRTKDEKKKK